MFAIFSVAALLATMASAVPAPAPAPAPAGSWADGKFYPDGSKGYFIKGNAAQDMCLTVMQDWEGEGTPHVVLGRCGEHSTMWFMHKGSTTVNTREATQGIEDLCMDAAVKEGPHDGADVRVKKCDGSQGQKWFWTDDGRIALEGQGFCLDVREGSYHDGAWLSIWSCITGNEAQNFVYDKPADKA